MRNLKSQNPNPKKIPNTNYQKLPVGGVVVVGWGDSDESMLLQEGPSVNGHPYDLEERTAQFGEAVIRFIKKIRRGPDNDRLISQLVGCGTSVAQIITRQTSLCLKRTFCTASAAALRRRKRQSSSSV